jgi:hypothetical protein
MNWRELVRRLGFGIGLAGLFILVIVFFLSIYPHPFR